MKNLIPILAICVSTLNGVTSISQAANIIDPNTTGMIDVLQEPFGSTVTLANPLPDPLLLGTFDLAVGGAGLGELLIDKSSSVTNTFGYMGINSTSKGIVTVADSGSQWINLSDLNVGVFGEGELSVLSSGVVSSAEGYVGFGEGSTGVATIRGSGSQWNNSSDLYVGNVGYGTLNVEAGALVNNTTGYIGRHAGSTSAATVIHYGSLWNNSNSLFLGGTENSDGGVGTLNLAASGRVNVGNDLYNGFLGTTAAVMVSDTQSNGKLWVRNGSRIENSGAGLIGFRSSSSGMAMVTGSGSQWNNSSDLLVGVDGIGTLNVEAEGVVSNSKGYIGRSSRSTSVVTVTGSGSQWINSFDLFVGSAGTGTLNVEAGGMVSNSRALIGDRPGSTGVVTVTGSGSQWNSSSYLWVGEWGEGELNVESGALVSNTHARIGHISGSTGSATVTGSGSQWINSSWLTVGTSGHGTLNVEGAGVVSNTDGYIGIGSGSTGVATVTGTGSQWNNSDSFYVGGSDSAVGGTGTLNVQDNGLVSVANTLKIWGPGTVNLDGGTLRSSTIDHTEGGTFNFLNGKLNVDTFNGDLTQNGGAIAIGSSPGITSVTGTYNQLGGSLEIELFSNGGGVPVAGVNFDQLTANSVMLAGVLDILADSSYSPTIGDTFPIISSSNGVVGTFISVNQVYVSGGFTFDVNYSANDVTLEVVSAFLGDFNLDGNVDSYDLTDPVDGWEARYGVGLDGGDLLDWQRNISEVASLVAPSTAVPEPSNMSLIVVGLLGIGYRCRKND